MNTKKLITVILAVLMMAMLFTGCEATAAAPAADGATAAGGATSSLIMIVMIFVIFYFLMIKPEKKRKQKAEEMRNSIEVGDKITTIGGMVGKVVHVTDDKITFETGEDRVRIEVTKWAVSSNDGKGAAKEKSDSEETLTNS